MYSDFKNMDQRTLESKYPSLDKKQLIFILERKINNEKTQAVYKDLIIPQDIIKSEIKSTRSKYSLELDQIHYKQAKLIFGLFMLWILPLLFIYILGWAIAWIYRGFNYS